MMRSKRENEENDGETFEERVFFGREIVFLVSVNQGGNIYVCIVFVDLVYGFRC